MPSIKLRTRSRTPVQLGRTSREKVGRSSQLANVGRRASCYCFAWRGLHRRGNAGIVWVGQPGDYATFNSNQPSYATAKWLGTVEAATREEAFAEGAEKVNHPEERLMAVRKALEL